MIKLNDNKNGLGSNNLQYQKNAIYIHNIAKKNNIKITDFDYIPDFGIINSNWIDDLHWTKIFYIKWCKWIISKIKILLNNNNIKNSKKNKVLIISDSSLDYYDSLKTTESKKYYNRKNNFRNIMYKNNIYCRIIAKAGGSFSSKYKYNNFNNMISKIKNKYSTIIIIGGINDCFCDNRNKIKSSIIKFIKSSKKFIL
jgi:hypothetical protein